MAVGPGRVTTEKGTAVGGRGVAAGHRGQAEKLVERAGWLLGGELLFRGGVRRTGWAREGGDVGASCGEETSDRRAAM